MNEEVCKRSTLSHIGSKFRTDKTFPHGYTDVYGELFDRFRDEEITIVEIGVFNYASVKMWEEYFTRAKIVGVDISLRQPTPAFCDRVKLVESDSSDPRVIDLLGVESIDIVIDDGSHRSADHVKTFNLLSPLLTNDCIYAIEDLQCQNKKHGMYEQLNGDADVNTLDWLRSEDMLREWRVDYHQTKKHPGMFPGLAVLRRIS